MVNLWRDISIPTYQIFTEAGKHYQVTIDLNPELRKLGATELQNIRYNKIGTEVRAKNGDTWYSSLDKCFRKDFKKTSLQISFNIGLCWENNICYHETLTHARFALFIVLITRNGGLTTVEKRFLEDHDY